MKKLEIKVFAIIFSILSIFLLSVCVINTCREYNIQKNNITNVLKRNLQNPKEVVKTNLEYNPQKIFLDYTIYTVLFDKDNNYLDLVNHTNNDIVDETTVISIAKKAINSGKEIYVSNLISDNYSYSFNNNNTLTIVDNTIQTGKMLKYIINSFISFSILEIVAYFVSKFLSKWVTDPVKESFEREKRFLADASHELKTPISVIMASTDAYNDDNNNKWIKNIRNESERMSKLVKELLDLTSLENDKGLTKNNENLSKIIESSVLTFESLFYERKIKLEYNICDSIFFNCNQDSIKELMSILIDNAIKYSDENGKVTVNLYKEQKEIILEVKNIGVPIADEDKEKIFERFYKVDKSRNRKFDNYGLGLSIAKRIVELHEGIIKVKSEERVTTFKIVWSQK